MMQHYRETPLGEEDYEVHVTRGFTMLRPQPFAIPTGEEAHSFSYPVRPLSETKRRVFGGFAKCCYPLQRFDSDPERRFAMIVDDDSSADKWIKPGKAQFQIEYRSQETYEPDFVVERRDRMLICEIKAENELADPDVQAKASAAAKWCRAASDHAQSNGGKPWSYVLIPAEQILANASLAGLAIRFGRA